VSFILSWRCEIVWLHIVYNVMYANQPLLILEIYRYIWPDVNRAYLYTIVYTGWQNSAILWCQSSLWFYAYSMQLCHFEKHLYNFALRSSLIERWNGQIVPCSIMSTLYAILPLTSVYNGPSRITSLQNKPKRVPRHNYKLKTRFMWLLSSEGKEWNWLKWLWRSSV
jgi:hypothetical protein